MRSGAAILALALSACGSSSEPFAVKCDGESKERSMHGGAEIVRRVSETFVIDPAANAVLVVSADGRKTRLFCEKPAVCDTRINASTVAVDGLLKETSAEGAPVRVETKFRLSRGSGSAFVDRNMTSPRDWTNMVRPMTCSPAPWPPRQAAGDKA
jgi:hypothetical protein